MREVLFRGKQMHDNEWIYGGALHQTDCYGMEVDRWFIIDGTDTNDYDIGYPIRVIPKTIGQYTGLKDKNGKKFSREILYNMTEKNISLFLKHEAKQAILESRLTTSKHGDFACPFLRN